MAPSLSKISPSFAGEWRTYEPTCSMCDNSMEVKCSDCHGGNYFCRHFTIQSHQHMPFHRMVCWTRRHLTPVSVYEFLFTWHCAVPWAWWCAMPTHCGGLFILTLILTPSILFSDDIVHHYQGKKVVQLGQLSRELGTPIPLPLWTMASPPPHYCTIPRTFRDCPQPCLSHWWSILPRGPIMYALQSWAIPTSLWSTTQAYLTWRYCIAFAPMLWRKMRADECLALSFKLQAYQLLLCWMTFWWTIWSARPQHNSTIQSFKA